MPAYRKTWQEPCIVFAPHWSLRLGPVVHLLRRWCGDPKSLLVLEQEVDAVLALLPFKPVVLKVLQCSFLSGIKIQKIQPLIDLLRPKLVLFPQDLRVKLPSPNSSSYAVHHYSENETLHITSFRKDFEVKLATDLAFQLRPIMMKQENLAIARVKGKLILDHGTFMLDSVKEPFDSTTKQMSLKWGPLDPNLLLQALQEKGLNGSFHHEAGKVSLILVDEPNKASIEIHSMHTVIRTDDESLASLLFEAVNSVLNGI
ncbi:integrator complex subunit [Thalictrum thalictroides]|uniref:Integrator complex subunit n=1 Tax=Thalictrum thalictroides TaxID=46969 RepID=A0A7J6XBK4_THATH|nr:integrator complex subunit [Thalictrum thalictroides]